MRPETTRLRWITAKTPEKIQAFCDNLGKRIEVKSLVWTGKEWVLWFIPDDLKGDVKSGRLK